MSDVEKIEISKDELSKIIAEAIKAEKEAEKRKAEMEKMRDENIRKIKLYFPGAKDEKLNKMDPVKLKTIAEKLDGIAESLGYKPAPVRKENIITFAEAIKQNFVLVLILVGALGIAAAAFVLR